MRVEDLPGFPHRYAELATKRCLADAILNGQLCNFVLSADFLHLAVGLVALRSFWKSAGDSRERDV